VLVTAAIGRRLAGPRIGILAGVVLALTPEFFRNADRYRLDYWHTLFMLGAVWVGAVMLRPRSRPRRTGAASDHPSAMAPLQDRSPSSAANLLPACAAGVCIGLALLTKPFFAFGTFPIMALWFVAAGRARLVLWLLPAAAISTAIAAPWHLSMIRLHGDAFIDVYILSQSVSRAFEGFEAEPWWWYLAYLARNHWPWLAVIVLAVARPRSRMFRRRAYSALAILWPLAWLLALSAFGDKRKQYLLPVYPGLAWVCAAWLGAAAPTIRSGVAARVRWLLRRAPIPALVAAVIAAFAVMPFVRRGDTAEWEALYAFMHEHNIRELWCGRLNYDDAGMIYVRSGTWPRRLDRADSPAEPPAGAWVIYDDADTIPAAAQVQWSHGNLVMTTWRTRQGPAH
jgi:4-amino-4-deoxy-L-arabinose transferase-like glycosyltransferase